MLGSSLWPQWGEGIRGMRMHLDLEEAWLDAETLVSDNCFLVLRTYQTPPGWCCWKMLDCTTGEDVRGRKSSR